MSAPTAPAYHYTVKMTCGGCSGAINRVLGKNIESPNKYVIHRPTQEVLVWGPSLPPFETVTEKIAKTGKEIQSKKIIESQGEIPDIKESL